MKAKAVVQPKKSTHSEDVTHGGGGTRRLHQLDPLLLCDRVFQLPANLKVRRSSSVVDPRRLSHSYLDKFEGYQWPQQRNYRLRCRLTCTPERYQRPGHRTAESTNCSTAEQLGVVDELVVAAKLLCTCVYSERGRAYHRMADHLSMPLTRGEGGIMGHVRTKEMVMRGIHSPL